MNGKLVYSSEKVAGLIASKMMALHGGPFLVAKTPQGFEVIPPPTFSGVEEKPKQALAAPAPADPHALMAIMPKAKVGQAAPTEDINTPFKGSNGWSGTSGITPDPKNLSQNIVFYGFKAKLVGDGKTYLTVLSPEGKLVSFGKSTLLSFSIFEGTADFWMDYATAKKRGLLT